MSKAEERKYSGWGVPPKPQQVDLEEAIEATPKPKAKKGAASSGTGAGAGE